MAKKHSKRCLSHLLFFPLRPLDLPFPPPKIRHFDVRIRLIPTLRPLSSPRRFSYRSSERPTKKMSSDRVLEDGSKERLAAEGVGSIRTIIKDGVGGLSLLSWTKLERRRGELLGLSIHCKVMKRREREYENASSLFILLINNFRMLS